jgi:uncharacterized protein (DUF2267 family)
MPAVSYRDDLLIAALEDAHGDDRTVLVGALGRSEGDAGPPLLRALVSPESNEAGHIRAAALRALGDRVGAKETRLYAAALSDRSVLVQAAAAGVLAEHGDSRATPDLINWLTRKLRRKSRAHTWDPEEIRSAVRYADRNQVLADLASTLLEHRDLLMDEERRWLEQVWPAALADAPSAGDLRELDRGRLAIPLFEEHRDDPATEDAVSALADEFVQKALARSQRRAKRD